MALVLVAAVYDAGASPPTLTLVFNQAIDGGGLDGSQVVVNDGVFTHMRQEAFGDRVLLDAQTLAHRHDGAGRHRGERCAPDGRGREWNCRGERRRGVGGGDGVVVAVSLREELATNGTNGHE